MELTWHQTRAAGLHCLPDDIIGYQFCADIYCEDCTREVAKAGLLKAGIGTMYGDCGSADEILREWAMAIGLDREDESSFDSGEFPKVCLRGSSLDDERCGSCGQYLSGDDY